jgi:hypothetical protein
MRWFMNFTAQNFFASDKRMNMLDEACSTYEGHVR